MSLGRTPSSCCSWPSAVVAKSETPRSAAPRQERRKRAPEACAGGGSHGPLPRAPTVPLIEARELAPLDRNRPGACRPQLRRRARMSPAGIRSVRMDSSQLQGTGGARARGRLLLNTASKRAMLRAASASESHRPLQTSRTAYETFETRRHRHGSRDLEHRRVALRYPLRIRHLVITKVRGKFTEFTRRARAGQGRLTESKVNVEIDVASMDTGEGQRDGHLKSPDFFDGGEVPEGDLHEQVDPRRAARLRRDRGLSPSTGRHGDHAATRRSKEGGGVALGGRAALRFGAKTTINREELGLKWRRGASKPAASSSRKKAELEIKVEAVKAK